MNLLVVGASHRTAEVSLLERMSVALGDASELLTALLLREHVTEAVVLSTCNRVEIYAGVTAFHGGLADVSGVLAQRAGVDPTGLASRLYVHWESDAVTHALRVASGLDSMVVGEAQIVGQLRDAYTLAADAGATGRMLHEVMQQALRVGKRARAETGIDSTGRNVVTTALERALAARAGGSADPAAPVPALGSAAGLSGVVVGSGSMGALALANLTRIGAGPVRVASRSAARAARLAESYQAEPVELAELEALIPETDLLISATASPDPVLTRETVAAGLLRRDADRGPLVICDLAMPRDVAPAVADLPGVVLIDMERLAAAGPAAAASEVAAVEEIVTAEAATIVAQLRDSQVAPTVAALRARADEVVATELSRLAARRPELTDEQRAEVAHAVHRLVQRLLHQPTVRVRQLASEPGGHAYAAVLAELFDLHVPVPRRADQVPSLVEPSLGAELSRVFGAEALGADALGAESLGVESPGAEALGPGSGESR